MGLTRPRLGQFQTTTTAFDDELIILNNGASGVNAKDIGIVFERGDSTNIAFIWDESADTFALVNTTEQGSTKGNVTITSYASLKTGDLISNGITYPTSDGTANQVIVTDGSGNLSFTTLAEASNTTYDLTVPTGTTTLRLTPSSGTVDDIVLTAGSNVTITRNSATQLTISSANHDDLTGFVANEHIDWTADQGATNIHASNYTNTTYTSSDFNHDSLSGFVANEHIDWTTDQGATNIHSGNYTNTTYSVGDGGLTQNDFTNTLKSKLDGIATGATNVTNNNQISNGAGYATQTYVDTEITNLIGGAPGALDTLNELAAAINDDASYASSVTTSLGTKLAKTGDTMTGGLTISGGNETTACLELNSADAIAFESGKHHITYNDATGNFNIRIGNQDQAGSEKCTEAGYVFHDEWSQSGGYREFNVSSASLAVGNAVTWRKQLSYSTNYVKLSYQGSTKLETTSSGVTVTGTMSGTATSAQYADLAENYVADANYEPGTVLVFGGAKEVTVSAEQEDRRIAGVVSTDPAHLMNSECAGEHIVPIALQGRVPCRVTGTVNKGDLIVSSITSGVGMAWTKFENPRTGAVIGKALEHKATEEEAIIEVVVGVR